MKKIRTCDGGCEFYHQCDGICDGKLYTATSPEMKEWLQWLLGHGWGGSLKKREAVA